MDENEGSTEFVQWKPIANGMREIEDDNGGVRKNKCLSICADELSIQFQMKLLSVVPVVILYAHRHSFFFFFLSINLVSLNVLE